ncbi:hypothetical protein OIU76_013792 [Salix suchowensis]|nr:universal stress family protein [Salix suchowensis]KAJ6318324.1 hypothetical protein OIU76_013792 [Salix suchowensis]KAJ6350945.1 hypothetical protein OIU78_006962 [Salix suchowensis]
MEEGKSGEKKKVMVAIDESENSNYALEWTLEKLRDTIADSDVIIFTAQPKFDLGSVYASTFGAVPVGLITSLQENQKKIASILLDKAKDKCAKYGIVAETVKEIGDPKYAICEAVEKLNIELLVLGSHNRGPVQRAFLGSVSNYCVNNAKCPVLVVKIPAV